MKVVQICKYRNTNVEGVDLFEEVIRSADGHERSFYILNGDAGDLAERLGCETQAFHLSKSDIKRIRPSAVLRVFQQLRRDRPDVIVTHRIKPAVFATWASLLLGRRVRKIAVIHNMSEFKKPRRFWFARLMMRDWVFVGCSEAVRDDMLARGFPPERTVAVPNAVDERIVRNHLLPREEARRDLGVPEDAERVIGTVGRMRPVKGHHFFIDAMKEMSNPPYVVIIGDGETLEPLRQSAREAGLEHCLIFAGGRRNAYRYVSAFDAFIMPSLREGLPIAILEAIAAGVPVFGTPVGGIPEILRSPEWLFPKEDVPALRDKLTWLGDCDATELDAVYRSQYQVFRQDFSIDRYHARFLALMEGRPQPE
jgi:glycosyltransferase involved in cell wall biosynthesis